MNVSDNRYIDTRSRGVEHGHVVLLVLVAGVIVCAYCGLVVARLNDPVERTRVERFARRQSLDITSANGNLVIRYLATTRRWRAGGLILAAVVFSVGSILAGRLSVSTTELFAGWFAGAVIAEWRVSAADSGTRRAARLVPRRRRDYLDGPARVLPVTAAMACIGLVVATAVGGVMGGQDVWIPLCGWAFLAIAGLTAVYVVQRRVLGRAQPVLPADVQAADDAIRVRSLRVIAGAGVAAAGMPAAALVDTLARAYSSLDPALLRTLSLATFLVAIVVGAALALARTSVDSRAMTPQTSP